MRSGADDHGVGQAVADERQARSLGRFRPDTAWTLAKRSYQAPARHLAALTSGGATASGEVVFGHNRPSSFAQIAVRLLRLAKDLFPSGLRFRSLTRWCWTATAAAACPACGIWCSSGAGSTSRGRCACAWRSNRWGRSSSNSARCCPPGATCCRPTWPQELSMLQDRVPPFPATRRSPFEKPTAARSTRYFDAFERTHRGLRLGRPGAFRQTAGRRTEVAVKIPRPGIEHVIATTSGCRGGGNPAREALAGRPPPQAARSGRRIRQVLARRARPDARSRQLLAAALQLQGLTAADRAGGTGTIAADR